MIVSKVFDMWANGYDSEVQVTDDNNEYPFAGYKNLRRTKQQLQLPRNLRTTLSLCRNFGGARQCT